MAHSQQQTQQRMEELVRLLQHHDHCYYVLDQPEVSDAEYDRLFRELLALEAQYPDLRRADSPTLRVGGKALDKFNKLQHGVPMLSLANALSEEEFRAFDERVHRFLEEFRRVGQQEAQPHQVLWGREEIGGQWGHGSSPMNQVDR